MRKKNTTILLIIIFVLLSARPVFALKNPVAVYCEEMGNRYQPEKTTNGEIGYCVLTTGKKCLGESFFDGSCGPDLGFCRRNGYKLITIKDPKKCGYVSDSCSMCVLESGERAETSMLMGLNIKEGICGDGICSIGELRECPADCPVPTIARPTPSIAKKITCRMTDGSSADLNLWRSQSGKKITGSLSADFNCDGRVDWKDYLVWVGKATRRR